MGAKIIDYTSRRISPIKMMELVDNESANFLLKEGQLERLLQNLKNKNIKFNPTNAKTEEIVANMLAGSALGAAAGALAAKILFAANPLIGLAIGGIAGAAAGYGITKYQITIVDTGKEKKGEVIFRIKLKPSA